MRYPYILDKHRRSERDIVACDPHPYGLTTNVKYPAHPLVNKTQLTAESDTTTKGENVLHETMVYLPLVERHHTTNTMGPYYNKRDVLMHVMYVNNPLQTVSVYEPLHDGSCKSGQLKNATVRQSAAERKCLVAVNAGLFNTSTGQCYGK